jgi:hypothetical protein
MAVRLRKNYRNFGLT